MTKPFRSLLLFSSLFKIQITQSPLNKLKDFMPHSLNAFKATSVSVLV